MSTPAPTKPPKSPRPLRCAVIGVGRMGRHHARVYAEMPDVELVGIMDADADRAAGIAEQWGTTVFESLDRLIGAGVDAVSIAVPTVYHYQVAKPLLDAGVSCLIEKPLAKDEQEARALQDLAERSDGVLMVGHIERFNPIMRAFKRQQEHEEPIKPRFIEVHRVSPMTFRSVDIGVVMDMMIHDLDVVLMLMGGNEPDEIHASGVPVITEHEDICNARLVFNLPEPYGKCVANITASRLALKTERVTRITGENAYIKIDYAKKTGTVIRRTANELQMAQVREDLRSGADLTDLNWSDLVTIDTLEIDNSEPIVEELRCFLDSVRSGSQPEIDARAGFVNVRTAQRIADACRADWAQQPKTKQDADQLTEVKPEPARRAPAPA